MPKSRPNPLETRIFCQLNKSGAAEWKPGNSDFCRQQPAWRSWRRRVLCNAEARQKLARNPWPRAYVS